MAQLNSSTVCSEMASAALKQQAAEPVSKHGPLYDPAIRPISRIASGRVFFRRKYAFDRAAGTVLLVATAPLTLSLYGLVKLTSKGPGFYRQKRVGLGGEVFEIVKLRTMIVDSERAGKAVWCVKNDPRVTPVGRILRKLHLDELPQLWNVAKGEMSLVGPRPERPEICETLATKIDRYYDRIAIKPGVTGLSQINLPPDETLEDVKRKQILDLRYIEEAGVWLEARILMATGLRMLGLKGETVMKSMGLCRSHLLPPKTKESGYRDTEASFAYDGPGKPR